MAFFLVLLLGVFFFTHEEKEVLHEYLRRPHMYGFTGTRDCFFTEPVIPQGITG